MNLAELDAVDGGSSWGSGGRDGDSQSTEDDLELHIDVRLTQLKRGFVL